jgi:tRNA threonylcarbamoyladenosine biosynthesis protein TsaE
MRLYHLDVYRLNHHSEVEDLGLVEILEDNAVTVIEWGERILDSLPASRLDIEITPEPTAEGRTFDLLPRGADWRNRLSALRLPEAMGSGAC